jgi:RNA polymerase sigma-70 factor (ECF subfamily)
MRERCAVDAFDSLVAPHRGELRAHCRRMLRSPHDADDAVQEAMLRAWRGLDGYQRRSSPRMWLRRIATNVCLDMIAQRRRRALPLDCSPTGVARLEPAVACDAEQRQLARSALATALAPLPERQLAVLILRDGLGYSAKEVADRMKITVAAANSALQRARAGVVKRSRHSEEGQGDADGRAVPSRIPPETVARLLDLIEAGEVSAVTRAVAPGAGVAPSGCAA